MSKKILVLLGHPSTDSLCGNLADRYQAAAEDAGHEVARLNAGELSFDPILHKGPDHHQELEPDLVTFRDNIEWADHILLVYPNWLCSMPAVLKGLFDRTWLPEFAFRTDPETGKEEQLLTGKTARVIVLSGKYGPFASWWKFGDFTNEIQYGVFGMAGIKSEVTALGPSENIDEGKKEQWIKQIEKLAAKGC